MPSETPSSPVWIDGGVELVLLDGNFGVKDCDSHDGLRFGKGYRTLNKGTEVPFSAAGLIMPVQQPDRAAPVQLAQKRCPAD